jgi:hypothetical protein
VIEENNKPSDLDQGYNPGDVSEEWVEQVLQGNIRPSISGVHINSIDLSGTRLGKVAYVVTVPQGKTAHQAADLKYYKRFNFESVAMYDHEIRDIMSRFTYPLVVPIFSDDFRLTDEDSRLHFMFQMGESTLDVITADRGAQLVWKIYADDMPPPKGNVSIGELVIPSPTQHIRYRAD